MNKPLDLLAIGVITGTHGLHGELKGKSFSGEPGTFDGLAEALFRKGGTEKTLRIEAAHPQPRGMLLLKIVGIDTPEEARRLVGYEIWVPREHASHLQDGEYYTADLCRCTVWFGETLVGTVRSVWDSGAAQLLEVERDDGKVFMVPFTSHFVGDVDVGTRRIFLVDDEVVR